MSAQDLVPKTKFEKQVSYTLLGEISEAVKVSEEKLPVFPSVTFMQIERIEAAFAELGYITCQEPYAPADNGKDFNVKAAREYALKVVAETIRFIKTLPKS